MMVDSVKVRGYHCFKNEWAGFDCIQPINIIIGRNNTGKSRLLDVAEALCCSNLYKNKCEYRCTGILDKTSLENSFRGQLKIGGLQLNGHIQHYLNSPMTWEFTADKGIINIQTNSTPPTFIGTVNEALEQRREILIKIASQATHKLNIKCFRRLFADRDIRPERETKELNLFSDGSGTTNIIRRYRNSSNAKFPEALIQDTLRKALNEVFGRDGFFVEITTRQHDEPAAGQPEGTWEIYLREEKKGVIALSQSGSGLKTLILVLLNLLVVPELPTGGSQKRKKEDFVFAFEELENNLHPALLRRTLRFIENYALTEKATVFLTTHSSVVLDMFGSCKHAQIIHVRHDGESASTEVVSGHFGQLDVISNLGAKPSDLLQANGIIWVEGPSDRIYLNRWIALFSDGKLREGRDYQCAFYGGALLAHIGCDAPSEGNEPKVNLLNVNPNIIVVCDGDRTAATGKGSQLKTRVRNLLSEIEKNPKAKSWITQAKEIESYIPGDVWSKAFGKNTLPNPDKLERIFPAKNHNKSNSYVQKYLKMTYPDKMEIAMLTTPHMTKENMAPRFELATQMDNIVATIESWNQ